MPDTPDTTRRDFIAKALTVGGGLLAGPAVGLAAVAAVTTPNKAIYPSEDLMRDHGLLDRILLIYEEGIRLLAGKTGDLWPIYETARIVRSYVEDFHEPLEEVFLFPRFQARAGEQRALVDVLRHQHQAGRVLTDRILAGVQPQALKADGAREDVARTLREYVRMYRAHESREDTVLFPALRAIVTPKEHESLRQAFAAKEKQLLGQNSYARTLESLVRLEKALGMYELADYTPKPRR